MPRQFRFDPYALDLRDERLMRDGVPVDLTHKAFGVLTALVSRPGQLVTKDELFRAVWPQSVVSDATLTQCVRELRQALMDDARSPRFIETVHGRGYRFVGPIAAGGGAATADRRTAGTVVGRKAELQQLHAWLEEASDGERRVVLVAGEPGIGKTTLVDAFAARSLADRDVPVAVGRCIEHFGAGEAYLPVLEALERLDRVPGSSLAETLRRYAPSWLAQLPALVDSADRDRLQRQLTGVTRERMLREIAQALEVLSSEHPLVLWLEDLHWSDYSTVDLLSCVARRTEPARLLIVGTYRPADVLVRKHPLRDVRQELTLHGHCNELVLDTLNESAVEDYLYARLGAGGNVSRTARTIHRRTEGHPLFMAAVVDDLMRRGLLGQGAASAGLDADVESANATLPGSLLQLIDRQFDRLSEPNRRLLEAASVAGQAFPAAAVAAALEMDAESIEERCAELARVGDFLQVVARAALPADDSAGHYRFLHAFHQQAVYGHLSEARRRQLHLRIAEWQERTWGAQAGTLAPELAMHFERGQDPRRAITYLRRAAEAALQRSAHAEAIALSRNGLRLLSRVEEPERAGCELGLQLALGAALLAANGFGAPEVGQAYARARALHQELGDAPELLVSLCGLQSFYVQRGELKVAREMAQHCMDGATDPVSRILTHSGLGTALYCEGDFSGARQHFEQAVALYDAGQHGQFLFYGRDPGVVGLSYLAGALWHLGYYDQAWQRIEAALTLAAQLAQPLSTGVALLFSASLETFRQHGEDGIRYAEQVLALANEQRYPFLAAVAAILRGCFLARSGEVRRGIEAMEQGLAARQSTGAIVLQPFYLALLAEAYAKLGEIDAALSVLSQALTQVEANGEHGYEAELYRLKGLVLAQRQAGDSAEQAEACLQHALAIARTQQARGWELRAATSLAQLWQQQGKSPAAYRLLGEVYAWFTEGLATPDLKAAAALLAALAPAEPNAGGRLAVDR